VQKIFTRVGFPFDVRICIDHARRSWLVSEAGVFESLNFATRTPRESHIPVTLRVTRDGDVDGFLLWLTAETSAGQVIDVLEDEYHWLPVFFPVFTPPVAVTAGDRFELLCSVVPSAGGLTPDYRVSGQLLRRGTPPVDLYHESPHTGHVFRGNGFHKSLFAEGFTQRFAEPASQIEPHVLKAYLSQTLPDYMLPAHFTSVASMPLTPAGKIDRQKLHAPERARAITGRPQRPRTDLERAIVEIWQDLLGVETVAVNENFFDLGGHSLLVIRVQSRLREHLKQELAVVDLFRYPTIAALAEYLATREPVVLAVADGPA
jgi:aryl carrier-like protein